jgi:hypothetical protein
MKNRLDADQLQRYVGHSRDHSGYCHGKLERAITMAAINDGGGGDVVVLLGNLPQDWHDGENERIHKGSRRVSRTGRIGRAFPHLN